MHKPVRMYIAILVGGLLAISLLIVTPTWAYVCTTPLDFDDSAEATWLPPFLYEFKRNDMVAFTTHSAVATTLELSRCNTKAIALQWMKAASHAQSDTGMAAAALGIEVTRLRGKTRELDDFLCKQLTAQVANPHISQLRGSLSIACEAQ